MAAASETFIARDGDAVFRDIEAARKRMRGTLATTPVLTSRTLDERTGASVFLKAEHLQSVGAFKFRGALNAMLRLDENARARGVLTYSSGNHAQAVARVGQMLGIPTVIVMPNNAPAPKLAATREYGAKVVVFDPAETTREAVAAGLPEARTHVLIPPFDHYDVIAGQGTCAMEFHRQVAGLDWLVIPTGGAGLLSGCSVATGFVAPGCKVVGVEPALADDAARSMRSGRIEVAEDTGRTIADGTRTRSVGERNFPLMQSYTHDVRTVTEAQIREAVRFAYQRLKQVVEPSGVLGLAAALAGALPQGDRVGIILTGGNVDPQLFAEILTGV